MSRAHGIYLLHQLDYQSTLTRAAAVKGNRYELVRGGSK